MTTLQPTVISNTDSLAHTYQSAYHTGVNQKDPNVYTEIIDWLIDSGQSILMSPYIEDFISDKHKSSSTAEVATGVLTKAPMQGTVKTHIEDILNGNECYILLLGVLLVPGISRRLLSVRQ